MTGSMRKAPGLALIVTALAAAAGAAQENLRFSTPADWTLGNVQETRGLSLLEFVKGGETLENWTEILTIVYTPRSRDVRNARLSYDRLRTQREERCPGVTDWRVLEEDGESLLYESRMTAARCGEHPAEWQLGRILYGKKTMVLTSYSSRSEITDEQRSTWIVWVKSVALAR